MQFGVRPQKRVDSFLKGKEQDVHSVAMSLTRMEEGRPDGVERNRSARWIGRKIATRAGFTSSYARKAKVHVWR